MVAAADHQEYTDRHVVAHRAHLLDEAVEVVEVDRSERVELEPAAAGRTARHLQLDAVDERRRLADRARATDGRDQRRGAIDGRGDHRHVDPHVLALEACSGRRRNSSADHVQRLDVAPGALTGRREAETDAGDLGLGPPRAEAGLEPSSARPLQGERGLGELHR